MEQLHYVTLKLFKQINHISFLLRLWNSHPTNTVKTWISTFTKYPASSQDFSRKIEGDSAPRVLTKKIFLKFSLLKDLNISLKILAFTSRYWCDIKVHQHSSQLNNNDNNSSWTKFQNWTSAVWGQSEIMSRIIAPWIVWHKVELLILKSYQ